MKALVFISCLALSSLMCHGALTQNYSNCIFLNYENNLKLHWTLFADEIAFAVEGDLGGYISIGISDDGSMGSSAGKFSDGWMFSSSTNNEEFCFGGCGIDIWMPDEEDPRIDSTQSLTNLRVVKENGHLLAEAKRLLSTGDSRDVDFTPSSPQLIIWAGHPNEPLEGNDIDVDCPDHRVNGMVLEGYKSVQWDAPSSCDLGGGGGSNGNSYQSPSGDFKASWTLSGNPPDTITFDMEATTAGVISMGISDKPRMAGSDTYSGWVDGNGQVTFLDEWSPDLLQPRLDASQDTTVLSGTQTAEGTKISFSRPLNTGDSNDWLIGDQDLYLLWAYTPSDGSGVTYEKHTAAGVGLVNFLTGNATGGGPAPDTGVNVTGDGITPPPSGWKEIRLDDFVLRWFIDGEDIVWAPEFRCTGWASFGISANEKMPDVDAITGWVTDAGGVVVLDTWSKDYNQPVLDEAMGGTDSLTVLSAKEEGGWTSFQMRRKLVTPDGNGKGDFNVIEGEMNYQYCYHSTSDGLSADYYPKHTKCAAGTVNWYTGTSAVTVSSEFPAGVMLLAMVVAAGVLVFLSQRIYWMVKQRNFQQRRQQWKQSYLGQKLPENVSEEFQDSYYYCDSSADGEFTTESSSVDGDMQPTGYYQGSTHMKAYPDDLVTTERATESPVVTSNDSYAEEIPVTERNRRAAEVYGKKQLPWWRSVYRGMVQTRIPHSQLSVMQLLICCAYVGLNILCAIASGQDHANAWGSLLGANSFLVSLPATRNSFLFWLFSFPFDRAIVYHRMLGRWVVLCGVLHTIFIYFKWDDQGLEAWEETLQTKSIYGWLAFASSLIILITSIGWMRRYHFNAFLYTHYLFFFFYLFGALHDSTMLAYVIATTVIYGIDKLLRLFWGAYPRKADIVLKPPANSVVQVRFAKHPVARWTKMHKIGQYVFLNFPQISPIEWHPFTVSSAPDDEQIEVHIRSLGNHTRLLLERAHQAAQDNSNQQSKLWVRTDGPYGGLEANYRRFPVVVMICGGIGVTPAVAMLKDLYRIGQFPKNHQKPKKCAVQSVVVSWSVQNSKDFHWFSEELDEVLNRASKDNVASTYPTDISLNVSLTREQSVSVEMKNWKRRSGMNLQCGRPDIKALLSQVNAEHPDKCVWVFCCGPRRMVNTTWDEVGKLNRTGASFYFHHEVFEF